MLDAFDERMSKPNQTGTSAEARNEREVARHLAKPGLSEAVRRFLLHGAGVVALYLIGL
jgi:hypothetical protein